MEFSNTNNNLSGVKPGDLLVKPLVLSENLVKLSTIDKGHNIEEAQLCLKKIIHSTEEWMISLEKNFCLKFSRH